MNTQSSSSAGDAPPGFFRRLAPAVILFFCAPYVAEFLLGNLSIDALTAMVALAPLYGGGALLVREVSRRIGGGWPTILLLGLVYGLVEEGLVIQTLFNPHYLGLSLLDEAFIPALGIGGWWTFFVLTLHTIWSVSVPIAVVEALFSSRGAKPWLGKVGLGVTTLLYLAGACMIYFGTRRQDPFAASPLQLTWVGVTILIVVILAFWVRRKSEPVSGSGVVPNAWVVGGCTFVLGLAFMTTHAVLHGWILVGLYLAIYAIAIYLLSSWSSRTGWTPLHTLAAGGGAMITYACTAFPQVPVFGSKGTIDLIGNIVFAAIAVVLLFLATRSVQRTYRTN
jgi:hypothetical protein